MLYLQAPFLHHLISFLVTIDCEPAKGRCLFSTARIFVSPGAVGGTYYSPLHRLVDHVWTRNFCILQNAFPIIATTSFDLWMHSPNQPDVAVPKASGPQASGSPT